MPMNRVRRPAGIPALLTALLAGCATTGADLESARDSWNGARYEAVVERWGPSARSTTLADGREVHTWVSEEGYGGSSGVSVGVFGGSGGGGVGAMIGLPGTGGGAPRRCERTLTFRDGSVAEQTWLGHPAFCTSFRRD